MNEHSLCYWHNNDGDLRGWSRSEHPPEPERCQACKADLEKRMARYDVKTSQSVEGRQVRVVVEGAVLDVMSWSRNFVQMHRLYGAKVLRTRHMGGTIYRAEISRALERGGY